MKMNLLQLKDACAGPNPVKVIVTGKIQFPPSKFPVFQLKEASFKGIELPLRSDVPESFYLPYTDDGVIKVKLPKNDALPVMQQEAVWMGEVEIKWWTFNGREGISFHTN